ncbi:AAA family ATPase [Actinomadura flavalba]|uniref:AAA family ATPase n=1 Tax=Actinomadura flavalba TaxID=1120938 RepID=UPI0003AA292F|nr:MinD/ParA family protein [Actinomadura flavalba]
MPVRDWQLRVLRDAGAADTGLVAPAVLGDHDPEPAVHRLMAAYAAEDFARRVPHGDPVLRRLGRGVVRGLGSASPGRDADLAARIGAPVPSCRWIAVTSLRGGAGKSTMAALVAGVLRQYRDDRVIAVDADAGLGSLPLRLGAPGTRTLRDLAAAPPGGWDATAAHLTRTPEGLWVLPAAVPGQVGDDLDPDTFAAAAGRLGRYFATAVIDCGGGLVSPLHHRVLSAAHAQIFVTPGTADGAISAHAALSWFADQGYRDLLNRTVVVLVQSAPGAHTDLRHAHEVLSHDGLRVVAVPHDRHLAAGNEIAPERVGAAARDAAVRIAAEAFAHALSGGA